MPHQLAVIERAAGVEGAFDEDHLRRVIHDDVTYYNA